jgi:tetratricopeptide (TPR) repeat protein
MERFFFSSHPANEERKKTADELVQTRYAAQAGKGKATSPDFERRRRLVLRQDARLNLAAGRLDLAEEEIAQALAAAPNDPVALALRGDLRLQRAAGAAESERRLAEEEALRDYGAAIAADDTYAPPHRGAGLILLKRGERDQARRHLERYLALAPGAEDARVIRDYLSELK